MFMQNLHLLTDNKTNTEARRLAHFVTHFRKNRRDMYDYAYGIKLRMESSGLEALGIGPYCLKTDGTRPEQNRWWTCPWERAR